MLVVVAASACTGDGDEPGTEVQTRVGVAATYADFGYYNPCANEPLTVDGTTYYPLLDEEVGELDRDRYLPDGTAGAPAGMLRVVPPSPGDDVGTMTVYDDGVALYVSDNGALTGLPSKHRDLLVNLAERVRSLDLTSEPVDAKPPARRRARGRRLEPAQVVDLLLAYGSGTSMYAWPDVSVWTSARSAGSSAGTACRSASSAA